MAAEPPDRFDALIDAAARAATDAAPSDRVRAEVWRRVVDSAPRPYAWRPRVAMATALATAAVVVVAMLWPSQERAPGTRPSSTAATPAASAAVAAPSREPVVATATIEAPGARRTAGRTAARQITVPEDATSADAMAPLTLDPVRQTDIELEAVATPERIDIDPVSVAPLAVATFASDEVQ
jgi:negative regulator of sigma E activity